MEQLQIKETYNNDGHRLFYGKVVGEMYRGNYPLFLINIDPDKLTITTVEKEMRTRVAKPHRNQLSFSFKTNPPHIFYIRKGNEHTSSMVRNWSGKNIQLIQERSFRSSPYRLQHYKTLFAFVVNQLEELSHNNGCGTLAHRNEDFNKFCKRLTFPILNQLDTIAFDTIPAPLTSVFRKSKTVSDLSFKIAKSRGRRTKKLIIERIEEGNLLTLVVAMLARGYCPIDYILEILSIPLREDKDNYRDKFTVSVFNVLRRILRNYSARRILTILTAREPHQRFNFIDDTARMYTELMAADPNCEIRDFTSFDELHDEIAFLHRKLRTRNFPLNHKNDIKALEHMTVGDMKVVLPDDNHTLLDFGTKLANCVGSYGGRINDGTSKILFLQRGDTIQYAIEIVNKHVRQFYGKHNSQPKSEDKPVVKSFLEKYGFQPDRYTNYMFEDDEDEEELEDIDTVLGLMPF